jgi:hypothetical protein
LGGAQEGHHWPHEFGKNGWGIRPPESEARCLEKLVVDLKLEVANGFALDVEVMEGVPDVPCHQKLLRSKGWQKRS